MGADHQDSGTGPPIRSLHVGLMGLKLGFGLEAMGVGEILSSPHLKLYRGFPGFVQLLSHVQLFKTLWTAAHQASMSFTISRSLLKLMSSESVMPSNHLIFCHPLLLLPSVFPSISVLSNELVLHIRWPKYWSFSFSISPFNEYSGLISFWIEWFDLPAV